MNKKSIMQLLFVALLAIGVFMLNRDVQSKVEQAAVAPSAEIVASDPVTSPATQGDTAAVTDTTPNYDPDDPFGVKFGLGGMAVVGIIIVLDWVFKQGVRAMSKKRGGG